ncbi:MAG: HAD hydrolase-like protein [Bacteroidota bacterium]
MGQIKQIIWDWNGTLLDDVEMCVHVMNDLLSTYNLPAINSEKYKQIFDFPVKDYYLKLGFDFTLHPFEKVGHEFMDNYFKELINCSLHKDVLSSLSYFKKMGINQMVLSAMEHESLENSLTKKGIRDFFTRVQGIDNHLAAGKIELAAELLNSTNCNASETLIIGDTLHDLEIAEAIGSACILVSNGHFSKERLLKKYNLVFDSIEEIVNYLQAIVNKY